MFLILIFLKTIKALAEEKNNNYETDYHLLTGNSSDAAFLRFHPVFFQEDENTWSIYKTIGWELFCDALQNNDKGFFTGKTVKLGADIEVLEKLKARFGEGGSGEPEKDAKAR